MGAAGAAVGTVLAGVVNLLILIGFILHQRIPFVLEFSKHFRWTKESLQNYLIKCIPNHTERSLIGVGNMMINVVWDVKVNRQSLPSLSFVLWKVSSLHSSVVSPMQPQFSLEKKLVPAITSLPLSALNVWFICAAPL